MERHVGLVGREAERDIAATFLAAAASIPAVLTLEGEAGIGKTTLVRYVVRLAREAGTHVLHCRPTDAESALSFAGLTDLLAGVADDVFDGLPSPQGQALAVAVLRREPTGAAPDARAIGTGLGTVLTGLASARPLLVVVDDAQWLDRPSLSALTFALRRIRDVPVGVLVSRRTGTGRAADLAAALPDPGWGQALTLAGLGSAALFHVVRDELGLPLSHPSLVRIAEGSQGNPYVAIELARVAARAGSGTAADRPLPDSLHALTADRLGGLSPAAAEAVLAVACSARPTLTLIDGLGVRTGLDEAEADGIVAVSAGRVDFTHPLLAAAAIELASRPAWRSMHARLGALVTGPETRARHWALARPEPDEDVAVALDVATESAAARGAPMAAADLARLALDRTVDPAGLPSWRRRLRLAELLHTTGATAEAGSELAALADCPSSEIRARGWLLLTEVAYQTSSAQAAEAYARSALIDAGDNPSLRARALLSLCVLATGGQQMVEYVTEARRCLEGAAVPDYGLLAWLACEEVGARFHLGEGLDRPGIDHALELERTGREWRSNDQVAAVRPVWLKWADYPEEALAGLAELRRKAEDEGNDGLVPYAVGHMSGILLRLGRTAEARAAAAEHLGFAEATGQESQRVQAMYNTAVVEAQTGELAAAEAAAAEILGWAEREDDQWMTMSATGVLGFVALSRDLPLVALPWFDRWWSTVQSLGLIEPGISRYHGDHIEALVGCGELGRAAECTAALAAAAATAGRRSAAAVALRCQGLLAAARGDHLAALGHLDGALALHAECPIPFERGRTLLVQGVVHRRAKEKRAAGLALAEAAAVFDAVGAAAWRGRAEGELGRVGRRPGTSSELTATEQRIAELAATGLTNRQVAEQAFISPKTVEANLARVYRKLGISSRAELGARMAAGW